MGGKLRPPLQRRSFHWCLKRAETSEGCPGTRTVANRFSAISVTVEPRGCREKKGKRNYGVARKWKKSQLQVSWYEPIGYLQPGSHCRCKSRVSLFIDGMFLFLFLVEIIWYLHFVFAVKYNRVTCICRYKKSSTIHHQIPTILRTSALKTLPEA